MGSINPIRLYYKKYDNINEIYYHIMDGYGWIWMDMDGYGWIWMDMNIIYKTMTLLKYAHNPRPTKHFAIQSNIFIAIFLYSSFNK